MMRWQAGIAWMHAGTVGNIAVTTPLIRGAFSGREGSDGLLACDLVAAGKYRNGAARQWCRTHQTYWGVKADLAALAACGQQRCASHAEPMAYVLDPVVLDMHRYSRVEITCTANRDLSLATFVAGQPEPSGSHKALAIACTLFNNPSIVQVNITPPAVQAYVAARNAGRHVGCIDCARCDHPHLDLGAFASKPHRRHYCGNCGNDSTHSAGDIVSSPLHALSIFYGASISFPS